MSIENAVAYLYNYLKLGLRWFYVENKGKCVTYRFCSENNKKATNKANSGKCDYWE